MGLEPRPAGCTGDFRDQALTELLGALALAGQLTHLHQSVEIAFGRVGDT